MTVVFPGYIHLLSPRLKPKPLQKGHFYNLSKIVGNNHECEGGIEKSVPRIAVWHHEACRVMTKGDPEGRICLSYPHTNNGFFFWLNTVSIYLFILK